MRFGRLAHRNYLLNYLQFYWKLQLQRRRNLVTKKRKARIGIELPSTGTMGPVILVEEYFGRNSKLLGSLILLNHPSKFNLDLFDGRNEQAQR